MKIGRYGSRCRGETCCLCENALLHNVMCAVGPLLYMYWNAQWTIEGNPSTETPYSQFAYSETNDQCPQMILRSGDTLGTLVRSCTIA